MNDYSFLQRLLHRLALGPQAIREMAFDLEHKSRDEQSETAAGRHVLVSSLARAGTTILTRDLHATGEFASLTYADMPFVLAPNLWARLRGRDSGKLERSERAHGDGIEVDSASPEAFEEVFWRTFSATDGDPVTDSGELGRNFAMFIAAVLARYQKQRYLSKNNANIVRLRYLCTQLSQATILVPVRSPLDHAFSLRRQHQRFVKMQSDDRFVLDYMNWLGHNEFGLGYQPAMPDGPPEYPDLDSIDHWLEEWQRVYAKLLKDKQGCGRQLLFVSHERLCAGQSGYWQSLLERIGLATHFANSYRPLKRVEDCGANQQLLGRCLEIHAELENQAHLG